MLLVATREGQRGAEAAAKILVSIKKHVDRFKMPGCETEKLEKLLQRTAEQSGVAERVMEQVFKTKEDVIAAVRKIGMDTEGIEHAFSAGEEEAEETEEKQKPCRLRQKQKSPDPGPVMVAKHLKWPEKHAVFQAQHELVTVTETLEAFRDMKANKERFAERESSAVVLMKARVGSCLKPTTHHQSMK